MGRIIVNCFLVLVLGLLSSRIVQAQGTTYLSNLGQTPDGSNAVGSDSWFAGLFFTGYNSGGYSLDSVQLGMAGASGNPSGFTLMVYSDVGIVGSMPGSSLGTLSGSANPTTTGIYTYTPVASIILSPGEPYHIVLTADTAVADGAYEWNFTRTSVYNPGDDWRLSITADSNDGSSWNSPSLAYAIFAINATPIPEPGVLSLFCLGSLGFLWHRRKAKVV